MTDIDQYTVHQVVQRARQDVADRITARADAADLDAASCEKDSEAWKVHRALSTALRDVVRDVTG